MNSMTSQATYIDTNNMHYELFSGNGRASIALKDLDSNKLVMVRGGKEEDMRKVWKETMDKLTAIDMAAKATAVIQ